MLITITTYTDQVLNYEVSGSEAVENIKEIVQAEAGIPIENQQLLYNSTVLENRRPISYYNIREGDVLMLLPAQSTNSSQPEAGTTAVRPPQPASGPGDDHAAPPTPEQLMQRLQADPQRLAMLQRVNGPLVDAIRAGDVARFTQLLRQQQMEMSEALENSLTRGQSGDVMDVDTQRKIEEAIQKRNIEENLAWAWEHSPEVFAKVQMLYVPMELNGHILQAFVDSGAQMTIMSQACAERCSLMRLVDKRFAGVAVGVGTSRIIGRIHQTQVKVGSQFISSSITVMEQRSGPEFIFGLDMLRRHQCSIDLLTNTLRFGTCNVELPFLSEGEVTGKGFDELAESIEQQADGTRTDQGGGGQEQAGGSQGGGNQSQQTVEGAQGVNQAGQGSGQYGQEMLQRLESMGFTREECIKALDDQGGNIDLAAAQLMGF